jgi:hypothetical protein
LAKRCKHKFDQEVAEGTGRDDRSQQRARRGACTITVEVSAVRRDRLQLQGRM